MSHIRKFVSFQKGKRRQEIIRESVLQVNDIYKVKSTIDIPQSLINAYVKKVKDNTGKNLYWGIEYDKIVPVLIKAVQEQQTLIEELKSRIQTLEQINN